MQQFSKKKDIFFAQFVAPLIRLMLIIENNSLRVNAKHNRMGYGTRGTLVLVVLVADLSLRHKSMFYVPRSWILPFPEKDEGIAYYTHTRRRFSVWRNDADPECFYRVAV